jgi:hypothetical protein
VGRCWRLRSAATAIAAQDGVFDKVNCGTGDYDAVVIDRGLDSIRNCENVYWQ